MDPSLFGKIGRGVGGLFGGPNDPRLSAASNSDAARNAILQAGLALMSGSGPGSRGTLPTLAEAVMLSRQGGAADRTARVQQQGQAGLGDILKQGGLDSMALRRALLTALTSGNMEEARAIASIIPSATTAEATLAPDAVNRQAVETVLSEAAGAPPELIARLGAGSQVSVQRDPRTGQVFWDSALPITREQSEYDEYDPNSPTGYHRVRVVDGQKIVLGPVAPPSSAAAGTGGVAGAEERRRRLLGGITNRSIDLAFSDPEGLSNIVTGTLARWSEGRGIFPSLARGALGAISPDTQPAQAGRQMLMATLTPLLSGAAMTDREREFYGTAFTVQENDLPQTINAKLAAVSALTEAFEQGVLLPETATTTEADRAYNAQVMRQIMQETMVGSLNRQAPGAPAPAASVAPAPANFFPPRN